MDDKQFQEIVSKIAEDPVKTAVVKEAIWGTLGRGALAAGKGLMGAGAAAGKGLAGAGQAAGAAAGRGLEAVGKKTIGGTGRFLKQRKATVGTWGAPNRGGVRTWTPGIQTHGKMVRGGRELLGGGRVGGQRLRQAVGAGVVGTGAAGAAGVGAAGMGIANALGNKQPQQPQQQPMMTTAMDKTAIVSKKVNPIAIKEHAYKTIAGGAGVAATIGGGALLFKAINEALFGNEDVRKEIHRETGKMNAKQLFKQQMLVKLEPKHKLVFSNLRKNDEIIANADKSLVMSTFETMKNFAPNLAADENAARSFLRDHATYDIGPSYATLKTLADSEKAIAEAGGSL